MKNNRYIRPKKSTLAMVLDQAYAAHTVEHTFDEVGSENADESSEAQAETTPHLLTPEGVSGAVNPALGEALTPMQSAQLVAQVVTETVEEAFADILSDPSVRAGHELISARIVAAVMAAPLHATDPSERADLCDLACGDTNDPFLYAFVDEVYNAVDAWSYFVPGPVWAPAAGGIDLDEMRLSVPVWEHEETGAVMFDLLETGHPDTWGQSRRHAREIADLHRRGERLFGPAFAGVRCIATADTSESRWLIRGVPPMRLRDIYSPDIGSGR